MQPQTVHVRAAVPSDGDAVWTLVRDFALGFRPEQASFQMSFDALLRSNRSLVLVAEIKANAVVGYLMANSHATFLETRPTVWVEEVMVNEHHRRLGVGTALMAAAEEWSRDQRAAYVALASRRSAAFYAALGYEDAAVFYKKTLT